MTNAAATPKSIRIRDVDTKSATCKDCGRPVRWGRTTHGKNIALEPNAEPFTEGAELRVLNDFVHVVHCKAARLAGEQISEEDRLKRQVRELQQLLDESVPPRVLKSARQELQQAREELARLGTQVTDLRALLADVVRRLDLEQGHAAIADWLEGATQMVGTPELYRRLQQ